VGTRERRCQSKGIWIPLVKVHIILCVGQFMSSPSSQQAISPPPCPPNATVIAQDAPNLMSAVMNASILCVHLLATTYNLSETLVFHHDKQLNVDSGPTTLAGNGTDSVLRVLPGATVFLQGGMMALNGGLYVTGGRAQYGGGIHNEGSLTILNSHILGNNATWYGGGVYNEGNLVLRGCTMQNNSGSMGGGLFNDVSAQANLYGCTIRWNWADTSGGGFHNLGNTTLDVEQGHPYMGRGCTLSSNAAQLAGGLYSAGAGYASLSNTNISNNHAKDGSNVWIQSGSSLQYALPAPAGTYVQGAFTCQEKLCRSNKSAPAIPCANQRCLPEFIGRWVADLGYGIDSLKIDTAFPRLCPAGYSGRVAYPALQFTSACAGPCPPGH
jgi:hypothetical protein